MRATSSCSTPSADRSASALAEELGWRAVLVTPDNIAGNELARSGDLAPANVRLAQAGGAHRAADDRSSRSVRARPTVRDRFSGVERDLPCAAVVDCGFRLPTEPLTGAVAAAGDCVAPRTVHEAILEGRRAAPGAVSSGMVSESARRAAGKATQAVDAGAGWGGGGAEVDAGTGVRHGRGETTGRVANWRQSVTPPVMSPPT